MINEDSTEKKSNKTWIISFIISGLCFLLSLILEQIDYDLAMIPVLGYLLSSLFGGAVFVKTNKPMIAKVIIISVVSLLFFYVGANEDTPIGIVLFSAAVIPLSIMFGNYNIKNSKEKNVKKVIINLLIIVIFILAWAWIQYQHESVGEFNIYEEEVAVRQYNKGFVKYEGQANVKGTNIKALIRDVMTHNKSTGSDTTLLIMVEYGTELPDEFFTIPDNSTVDTVNKNAQNVLGLIENGKTYKVTCQYDNHTGYVTKIAVYQTN